MKPYHRPPYHHQDLPLPYDGKDPDREMSNLSALISYDDKNLIRGICPKKGILSQLTQNFFNALTTNLRNNGVIYYSPEHEQYLIQLINIACETCAKATPTQFGQLKLKEKP